MRVRRFLGKLSKRTPTIVIATWFAALLGAWIGGPTWLANGLAIIVGILALIVLASREHRRQFVSLQEEGLSSDTGWIGLELAGKGTPLGSYLLAFFSFLTVMLTGFDSPYSRLAWASFALAVAWSIANAQYPVE